ncbi:hypothetical protein DDB_G0276081 [Dictyostelium discoideum AX4]|uniref:Uncharacterized protein n=1 Tax=Dictyostelium discoideum TaxID=44689 RepID=Q75JK8_DICDI|nr:hypothetical protein DDB_G0276081 [Dictyostelium discoideum AX4]EAL69340.1 hypothetical protein DDB_G0276081 [Dictyostelium discoideum AX4]|eukprot:XP_643311.1 hypothetical protein DDB_G0276081 [Dictyostelium discoideum AX4]
MKKPINNNNNKIENEDIGTSSSISGSAQSESVLEPSTNIIKQQKPIKNKKKTNIIETTTETQQEKQLQQQQQPQQPKENIEIFVKSIEVTNIINSMLSCSPHFEKYSKQDNDTSEMLKKYTDIKQNSNDPNQSVNSKNNSPFYMLDNKDDKKSKSQQQQQKTKELQKSKDVSSMTKNHLENILIDKNKKQNSYISAQNNNNSFRYKPYDNNNNNNYNNNKFSKSNNEDNESKSSSINRNSKINKINSQQPKKGMWD